MLKELVEKRARLWEQAGVILKKAEEEKRELTAEEQANFDAIHDEMGRLKATIDRLEQHAKVTRDLEESRGRRTEPVKPAAALEARREDRPAEYGAARYVEHTEADRLEGFRTWLLAGSDYRLKITPLRSRSRAASGFPMDQKHRRYHLGAAGAQAPRPGRHLAVPRASGGDGRRRGLHRAGRADARARGGAADLRRHAAGERPSSAPIAGPICRSRRPTTRPTSA